MPHVSVQSLRLFFRVPNLEEFMKQPCEIGLQFAMRRLYVLVKLENEVPHIFPTRREAWLQYKVLLDDYTGMNIAQNDNVKEDVSKIIELQLKVCGNNTRWKEINTKPPQIQEQPPQNRK